MVNAAGTNWGKYSDEWVLHFKSAMDDEKRNEEDALIPRIRKLLKIPDLEMKMHKVSH